MRSLTLDEQCLVEALLAVDVPGAERLRAQVPTAQVSSSCACGCGSIGFAHPAVPDVATPMPVEGEVLGDDGEVIGGLILFVRGGWLDDLDVYSVSEKPLPLPDPAHVRWIPRQGAFPPAT